MNYKAIQLAFLVIFTNQAFSQSTDDISDLTGGLDREYLESLPDEVRSDLLKEISKNKNNQNKTLKKRPSTELSKLETVRNWEEFQKQQLLNEESSERYGINLFRTMQSSFMPINEPNFGSDYILDYGDFIEIRSYGMTERKYSEEINRDGSITIEGIGRIQLAGLNFSQAVDAIKLQFKNVFIGSEVIVNLAEIRDIKVLITGNALYPGMYTISGNSNILQAINLAGGIKDNGSLREITLIRDGNVFQNVDLYQALIFGDTKNIPTLRSGDSINIKSAKKLVRAGSGFVNESIFELKENETFGDLLLFAGGISSPSTQKDFSLIRFSKSEFRTIPLSYNQLNDYIVENLDTINLNIEKFGTIEISGDVRNPGKYSISSTDRLSDVIRRAGGYSDSAYIFGSALYREKAKTLEKQYADRAYENLIKFLASDPKLLNSQGASFLPLLLSEIKNIEPSGRVTTEFNLQVLKDNPINDIYVNDKDKIFIPKLETTVFIYGEISNPGSLPFVDGKDVNYYINNSGGISRYAENDFIYIVSPDGVATRISQKGISMFFEPMYDIYPGSVIYVPREIGKIQGIDFYATVAPVFGSLALSIASLNAIND